MTSLRVIAGSIFTIALSVSSGRAERVGLTQIWVDIPRPLAYRIEGGSGEFLATGEICSLMQSFVVAGGGYDYSGKVDGVAVKRRGTYEVQYDGRIAFGIVAASLDLQAETEFYKLEHVRGACRD